MSMHGKQLVINIRIYKMRRLCPCTRTKIAELLFRILLFVGIVFAARQLTFQMSFIHKLGERSSKNDPIPHMNTVNWSQGQTTLGRSVKNLSDIDNVHSTLKELIDKGQRSKMVSYPAGTGKSMLGIHENLELQPGTEERINQFFDLKSDSEKDPLLNLHKFAYSLDSDICSRSKPTVVMFIHSATENFARRGLVRRTWGVIRAVRKLTLNYVFMMGQTTNQSLQKDIETETANFGDIVQGNFLDTYHNLTYKHIMGLRWVVSKCPSAKMIVKLDDDVLVNVFNLVELILKSGFRGNFMYCNAVYNSVAIRDESQKWYVNHTTYPFRTYPPFCLGAAYLVSPDVARLLCAASKNTRFYWVDDVYVTGILALKIDQILKPKQPGHLWGVTMFYNVLHVNRFMFFNGRKYWLLLWKAILQQNILNL